MVIMVPMLTVSPPRACPQPQSSRVIEAGYETRGLSAARLCVQNHEATLAQMTKLFIIDSDTPVSCILILMAKSFSKVGDLCVLLNPWGYTVGATTTGPSSWGSSPARGYFLQHEEVWGPGEVAGFPGHIWEAWGSGILPGHGHLPKWKCFNVLSIVSYNVRPAHSLPYR